LGQYRDDRIYYSSFDGNTWSPKVQVPGSDALTDSIPALTSYNNKLYMAWKKSNDPGIFWNYLDGNTWTSPQKVQGVGTSIGPSLNSYNNKLYMAWKGSQNDPSIWWNYMDVNTPWTQQNRFSDAGTPRLISK
jgi:hypothetical protein